MAYSIFTIAYKLISKYRTVCMYVKIIIPTYINVIIWKQCEIDYIHMIREGSVKPNQEVCSLQVVLCG